MRMIASRIPQSQNDPACWKERIAAVQRRPTMRRTPGRLADTPKLMKLIAPVALPFTLSGFASLMIV